jgi:hypothetical protein
VVGLGLGAAWVFFAQRRRKRAADTYQNHDPPIYKDAAGSKHPHYAADHKAELSGGSEVRELPTGRETHELPA